VENQRLALDMSCLPLRGSVRQTFEHTWVRSKREWNLHSGGTMQRLVCLCEQVVV